MSIQVFPKPYSKTLQYFRKHLTREHGETFAIQEQFTGPVPLRRERPAAEILAERLRESDPTSPSPLFIP